MYFVDCNLHKNILKDLFDCKLSNLLLDLLLTVLTLRIIMKVSLRKSNTIQLAIQEAIKSIEIVHTIELNQFQDVMVELQRANTELFANDTRRQQLLLALYNIRGLVGTANSSSGIDLKLAQAAFIDKRIAQLSDLLSVGKMVELTVLQGKLEKIKNRKEDSGRNIYGRDDDTVVTGVIAPAQLEQLRGEIRNLKKQKQKLNDEVLALNINTEIPLSTEVVDTLSKEGLI